MEPGGPACATDPGTSQLRGAIFRIRGGLLPQGPVRHRDDKRPGFGCREPVPVHPEGFRPPGKAGDDDALRQGGVRETVRKDAAVALCVGLPAGGGVSGQVLAGTRIPDGRVKSRVEAGRAGQGESLCPMGLVPAAGADPGDGGTPAQGADRAPSGTGSDPGF